VIRPGGKEKSTVHPIRTTPHGNEKPQGPIKGKEKKIPEREKKTESREKGAELVPPGNKKKQDSQKEVTFFLFEEKRGG